MAQAIFLKETIKCSRNADIDESKIHYQFVFFFAFDSLPDTLCYQSIIETSVSKN